jgi:hypothetical protein
VGAHLDAIRAFFEDVYDRVPPPGPDDLTEEEEEELELDEDGTLPRLVERAAAIEAFHNTHHRYSALRGRPPCVACTPGTMWCYV